MACRSSCRSYRVSRLAQGPRTRRMGQYPAQSNRKEPVRFSSLLYKARNRVERFFHKLKCYRRAAIRYDKLRASCPAMIKLARIRITLLWAYGLKQIHLIYVGPIYNLQSKRVCGASLEGHGATPVLMYGLKEIRRCSRRHPLPNPLRLLRLPRRTCPQPFPLRLHRTHRRFSRLLSCQPFRLPLWRRFRQPRSQPVPFRKFRR